MDNTNFFEMMTGPIVLGHECPETIVTYRVLTDEDGTTTTEAAGFRPACFNHPEEEFPNILDTRGDEMAHLAQEAAELEQRLSREYRDERS